MGNREINIEFEIFSRIIRIIEWIPYEEVVIHILTHVLFKNLSHIFLFRFNYWTLVGYVYKHLFRLKIVTVKIEKSDKYITSSFGTVSQLLFIQFDQIQITQHLKIAFYCFRNSYMP